MVAFLNPDILLRPVIFFGLLATILLAEWLIPRRRPGGPTLLRRGSNLALGGLNILVLRFGLPLLGYALAVRAAAEGWGLFAWLELPLTANLVLSLLFLDLAIWAQHWLFHHSPPLWRLHRMHHTDTDFDATTAVRFHPFEAVLSLLIKSAVVVALGVAPLAYLIFEILLSSTSLFNHGNFRIPSQLDRYLRWFVVTPDMHRVHHSVEVDELNSNFGFNLPWWDRLFGTYRPQPKQGHEAMAIGLDSFRSPADQRLIRLLRQPFAAG